MLSQIVRRKFSGKLLFDILGRKLRQARKKILFSDCRRLWKQISVLLDKRKLDRFVCVKQLRWAGNYLIESKKLPNRTWICTSKTWSKPLDLENEWLTNTVKSLKDLYLVRLKLWKTIFCPEHLLRHGKNNQVKWTLLFKWSFRKHYWQKSTKH